MPAGTIKKRVVILQPLEQVNWQGCLSCLDNSNICSQRALPNSVVSGEFARQVSRKQVNVISKISNGFSSPLGQELHLVLCV